MNARRLLSPVVASLALLTASGFVVAPAAFAAGEEGCANEGIRTSQDANALPECRAWELVTPAEKGNVEAKVIGLEGNLQEPSYAIGSGVMGFIGSSTGERMAWVASETLAGSKSVSGVESVGTEYLATRGDDGWSSEDVIPRQSPENGTVCSDVNTGVAGYTADLSKIIVLDGAGQNYKDTEGVAEEDCGHNEPSVAPEEPAGSQNIFVRDDNLLSYQLVNVTPKDVAPENAQYEAGSADFSHVVFEEEAPLTTNAPSGMNLYEWSGSKIHLVTILPGGEPVRGALPWIKPWAGPELRQRNALGISFSLEEELEDHSDASQFTHTVSGDGSRVFFQADGNLYVREDGAGSDPATVQLDKSQGSGPGGGGRFMAASVDGSKVFFTDEASAELTTTTVVGSGENLYEYELPEQTGQSGTLVDLTAGSEAKVMGLAGAGEDGSYVYFVAEGVLASGATAGQPNLYVSHSGVTSFIATLEGIPPYAPETRPLYPVGIGDICDWTADCLTARVSPNGHYLGFTSSLSLTGYDSDSVKQVYLYDAVAHVLGCASCDPTGAPPVSAGGALIRTPTQTSEGSGPGLVSYLSRNVTDSGQVFFDTPDPLVPKANNGRRDVYEYRDGHDYLLSSGTQAGESFFLDASENGSDVFFTTTAQLVRKDTDESYDIYDARAGGGFIEQGFQPECADEGCRGLASNPPVLSLPNSASLVSSGNVVSIPTVKPKAKPKAKPVKCKKGYVKRKGKCVRKRKAKAKKSAKGRK